MKSFCKGLTIVAAAIAGAGLLMPVADAQNRPVAPAQNQTEKRDPVACADHSATTGTANNLGDKLARTDGVICPPAGVDPEIKAPTPQGGTMPVIPPPGSPGGDPSVRPK